MEIGKVIKLKNCNLIRWSRKLDIGFPLTLFPITSHNARSYSQDDNNFMGHNRPAISLGELSSQNSLEGKGKEERPI